MTKKDWRRQIAIEKSREEFALRLKMAAWRESEGQAALFRLNMLLQFAPEKSDRQIANHAKINCF